MVLLFWEMSMMLKITQETSSIIVGFLFRIFGSIC